MNGITPSGRLRKTRSFFGARPLLLLAGACLVFAGPGAAQYENSLGLLNTPPELIAARTMMPPFASFTSQPAIDWRTAGAVTSPKNQGACGSCWAFAAINLVESMALIGGAGAEIDLSEQHVVSCDTGNSGCNGGNGLVFGFLQADGTRFEDDIPYGACDATGGCPCTGDAAAPTGWTVEDWGFLPVGQFMAQAAYEATLKAALVNGPVWVGMNVYADFMTWWSADTQVPYLHLSGGYLGGHAVLLIGYNDAGGYWIMQNSWGATGPWGDGTGQIAYDKLGGNCAFGSLVAAWCTIEGPSGKAAARACCVGTNCSILSEATCTSTGGVWLSSETLCAPATCPEPPAETVAVCCAGESCYLVTEGACADLGGSWTPGSGACSPNPCDGEPPPVAPGVCCLFADCYLLTAAECGSVNGTWDPNETSCSEEPCESKPLAVCCSGGACTLLAQDACIDLEGAWFPGLVSCAGSPCQPPPTVQACCRDESCELLSEVECSAGGGVWDVAVTCDPNPCDGPSDVVHLRWGRIKSLYR